MKKNILFILILNLILLSCKKEDDCPTNAVDKDSLIMNFNAFAGGPELKYRAEFKDPLGRTMFVEQLIHYVSNIYLLNGDKSILISEVALLTYEDKGEPDPGDEKQKIRLQVPVGTYTGIKFGIGLNKIQNQSNPSSYPNNHPLSPYQGTTWANWGYKFVMIEGRIDSLGDGVPEKIYGIHTGFDTCYVERTFDKKIEIKKGISTQLNFHFDVSEIFFGNDTIDLTITPFSHGEVENLYIAIDISNNLANSLTLD